MKTLKIKLKQHTPLIHFQHDQEGATLRASEVKPKLDRFVLTKLGEGDFKVGIERAKKKGWLIGKGEHLSLDYKMKIEDEPDNIYVMNTNEKRIYSANDERKDKKNKYIIENVEVGQKIEVNNQDETKNKYRYVIKEGNKSFFGKLRKSDSTIIYDLKSYPCFFANMDANITNPSEYRKIIFTENPFTLIIHSKKVNLLDYLNNSDLITSFFLNHNFGTRQSKGFGSFYVDENDVLYRPPYSQYRFNVQVDEDDYYDEFFRLFNVIELFTRTLRAGINEKRGQQTVFYFKSLAFKYCKDVLKAEWDKKCVKKQFYFKDSPRRRDSLIKQRKWYANDEYHDILFYDSSNGYDLRDLLGYSTNEQWLSYKDSIEKKVAVIKDERLEYPRKEDKLPVERMRSPLLIKPICNVDEYGKVSYEIFLLLQDKEVGMSSFKKQKEICFFSKREKNQKGQLKRFMLKLPQGFSMSDYFDYIFNETRLNFNISTHVEDVYQTHENYKLLEDIFTQVKDNLK